MTGSNNHSSPKYGTLIEKGTIDFLPKREVNLVKVVYDMAPCFRPFKCTAFIDLHNTRPFQSQIELYWKRTEGSSTGDEA